MENFGKISLKNLKDNVIKCSTMVFQVLFFNYPTKNIALALITYPPLNTAIYCYPLIHGTGLIPVI